MSPRRKAGSADSAASGDSTGSITSVVGKSALSRDRIVDAAMSILDNEGYAALSMRRLGKELSVDPMSIYYHLPSKSALLDAMVERVYVELGKTARGDDPTLPVEERLVFAARTYRDALMAHSGLVQTLVERPPRTPAGLRPMELLTGIFLDAGFTPEAALNSVNIFAAYVRGVVVRETPYSSGSKDGGTATATPLFETLDPDEFPNLTLSGKSTQYAGFETEFDRGARALIRGLLQIYGKKQEE